VVERADRGEFPKGWMTGPTQIWIAGIDPALIIAAPRYGLRYGSAPATGDFQRLRGRPPLVSPLKSCMGRSFTAVTRVSNPVGDANKIKHLEDSQKTSQVRGGRWGDERL